MKKHVKSKVIGMFLLFSSLIFLIKLAYAAPNQDTPYLNTTDWYYNTTNSNLTIHNVSSTQVIKNIYSWVVDNEPYAAFYLPIENHTGTETAVMYDFSGNDLKLNRSFGVGGSLVYNESCGPDGGGCYNTTKGYIWRHQDDIPDIFDTSNITMCIWANHIGNNTAPLQYETIASMRDSALVVAELALGIGANEAKLTFYSGLFGTDPIYYSDVTLTGLVDQWYHLCAVSTATNGTRIYLDGELNSTTVQNYSYADHIITVGGFTISQQFHGLVDDLMIFNRSLSPEQIRSIYNNGLKEIVNNETTVGETWYCNVTPHNGSLTANDKQSNIITIQGAIANYPPIHGTPKLNATDHPENTSNANLTAYNQSPIREYEGETIKWLYNWYTNGNLITLLNMPFENTTDVTSDTLDYSGNNNNGIINGSTWSSSSGFDGRGAYTFDGLDDEIILSDGDILINTSFTICVWANATDPANNTIFSTQGTANNRTFLFIRNDTVLSYGIANGSVCTQSLQRSPGFWARWNHYCLTLNDSNVSSIYLNGTYLTSKDCLFQNKGGNLSFGRMRTFIPSNFFYFNGTIDDIMIFNKALSEEQINAIYTNNTNLMVSQDTNQIETWNVELTPHDGYGNGTPKMSNDLYIRSCGCPSSGDWNINCSDSCTISSNCDLNTNNLIASGLGLLTLNANITNWTKGFILNQCKLNCIGGDCIK
ncbi:LamG-like jellyroll fold domain-containing protein [Nanoarchaeota archaeon]